MDGITYLAEFYFTCMLCLCQCSGKLIQYIPVAEASTLVKQRKEAAQCMPESKDNTAQGIEVESPRKRKKVRKRKANAQLDEPCDEAGVLPEKNRYRST